MTRAAIYARFSSDLQDARSIVDQTSLCRVRAASEGWEVAAEYSDAAISGAALHNRPGLLDLLMAAKSKSFEIVLTESLDRLSRDLEDIAGLHKRLSFWGVRIVTLADGEVNKLHVGLKGLISSIFLDDLAQKTRRGHIGRLNAGRLPGGKLFGYDVVKGDDKGLRTINPAEAEIVRRIFREYVTGASPRAIVKGLNREGVQAPRGGLWNASTITGHPQRQNGIIQSRLYVGEVVYNRERMVKDPATGKRVHTVNPPSAWLTHLLPELAIVDRDTFDRAQELRQATGGKHLTHRRRPKHLLSGKVRCGCCGHQMIVVREDRLGCSGRINKAVCDNAKTIRLGKIQERVLDALKVHLLRPDLIAAAIEFYRQERERLASERAKAARAAERDLSAVEGKIRRIVAAIEDGGQIETLTKRLADLEREKREISARAPKTISDNVLSLHPNAANVYRAKIENIQDALAKGDRASEEALQLVRELISSITVTPESGGGGGPSIEFEGDLAAMLAFSQNQRRDVGGNSLPLPINQT